MSSTRRFRALFAVGTLAAGLLVTTAEPAAATSSINVANLGVAQEAGETATAGQR
jgi:hypothetical protein